jgi:putative nucleotidyltransferase with HDIG domain
VKTDATTTGRMSAEDIAASVAELPALPASVAQVIGACDDGDMTVGQLSQLILRDQSLTAGMLRLANSAFYGHARRVTTVTDAIVLLGFSAIKSLAISTHTTRLLNRALPGYGLVRGELLRHSVSVALTARRLAVAVQLAPVEEAFVAGLLHDIGKTILSSRLEGAYEELADVARARRQAFHEVEIELLGFDHAELGAQVARAWSFPADLEEAIRHHHLPARAERKPRLAHTVHLADAACMMLGVGLGVDGLAYGVDPASLDALGIDAGDLERLMDEMAPVLSGDLSLVG